MNNLYVISNDDALQLVDDIGLLDESRPLDLDGSRGKQRAELRFHQRYQLREDAFALIRSNFSGPLNIQGKSMGGIACAVFNAKPSRIGKIDNISMGGLKFRHVDSKMQLSKALVLDILLAGCGFYLANVAYKIVSDVVIPEDVSDDSIAMRQVRLQFQYLSAYQQMRLKDFIVDHGAEIC
jgi:hypothetical protein